MEGRDAKSRKYIWAVLTLVGLVMLLTVRGVSTSMADGLDLFSDAGIEGSAARIEGSAARIEGAAASYNQPPHVVRYRYVNVNFELLPAEPATGDGDVEVTLNLFPDANYDAIVKKVEYDPSLGTIWTGTLDGVANSHFTFLITEGVFIANIASTEGVYEVSLAGDGFYRVIEVDQSELGDCGNGAYEEHSFGDEIDSDVANMERGVRLPKSYSKSKDIDIMVAYTIAARDAVGGAAAMRARIALAVSLSNQAYENSGVRSRLRLVRSEEVDYTEFGDTVTDLDRLAGTSDGYMDDIHSLRDTYGADMVALILASGPWCGYAKDIKAGASTAFQVTKSSSCMTTNYSFAHEFAHLQGARHDVYVDSKTKPYRYGHGYVHPYSTDPADQWRTIMAYNDRCEDWGYYCNRLQYFSRKNNKYNGDPIGDRTSQNYKVIDKTANKVKKFRPVVIGEDIYSTYDKNIKGWRKVIGKWKRIKPGYYTSSGLPDNSASAYYRYGLFGDLTYEVQMKRTGICTTCANRIIIRGDPSDPNDTNNWLPSYNFQYSNKGSFSVWEYLKTGVSSPLQSWTAHDAIIENDWNTLKVVAVGSSLNFYINGTLVWSGNDVSFRTGRVGFGFYRNAEQGTLYVNSATLSTTATAGDSTLNSQDLALDARLQGGNADISPTP